MVVPRILAAIAAVAIVLAGPGATVSGPAGAKRIAFLIDSWYPWSHADVIGRRFLDRYRVGDRTYTSPVTVASVFPDAPHPTRERAQSVAAQYGFRLATSIADALLGEGRSRLAVDGVLIATREDLPGTRQRQSPVRRVQVVREVLRLMDQSGTRVPIFIDKMLAGAWTDSQAIVAEAGQRGVPLMAGSVLPFVPLDQPLRSTGVEVAVVMASTPYWAFGFHAAELLQGFLEHRTTRETGIAEIQEVGLGYASLPDRDRWGGRVFDALWATPRTRRARAPAHPAGLGPATRIVLIRYVDGTRAVLALIPELFDDSEFLLGAQYAGGAVSTSGLILRGEPYDHFGYLVHALVEFFTTGRAPVPVERTLLTTGLTIFGQESNETGRPIAPSGLAVTYRPSRPRP